MCPIGTICIYPEDHELVQKLLTWFLQDEQQAKQFNINLHKGILLTGPIGCGKTSLMSLMRLLVPQPQPHTQCFDDLGAESTFKYYGYQCNVMGEILLSRYDHFISNHMLTHATTNLSASELEDYYGNRVRSRMREMFNLIAFDGGAKDKRK